jgi:manganese-dependent ADP-ribose/CDP-alcohol diphosphatase
MKPDNPMEFQFGIIADCQYCDIEREGIRYHALSESKLNKSVKHLNRYDPEFVVNLGDLIDRDYESFDVVLPIIARINSPVYHVLGNHDFFVAESLKEQIPEKIGMASRYYDFVLKGWRFIVLDGNDISFYAYPRDSDLYERARVYYEQNNIQSPTWNGGIGDQQILWLRNVLEKASSQNEKAMIFCHFPVYPENIHNLWNDEEIVRLLSQYSCVKAYINGHHHEGNYGKKNGIHYLTLKGMVDTEHNAYATVKVYHDRLEVEGYGREGYRVMEIQ